MWTGPRVQHGGVSQDGASRLPPNADAPMQTSRNAALRNIKNNHSRQRRQRVSLMPKNHQKVTSQHGTVLAPPDEDVIVPAASEWPESRHPRLCPPRNVSVSQDPSGTQWPYRMSRLPNDHAPRTKMRNFRNNVARPSVWWQLPGETTLLWTLGMQPTTG